MDQSNSPLVTRIHQAKHWKIVMKIQLICQYFSEELIINNGDVIRVVNLNDQDISFIEYKSLFEYCLHKYQSTFITYRLKENRIYFIIFEINENNQLLFESIKCIEIDVDELHENSKIHQNSNSLKNFQTFNTLPEYHESKMKYYHQFYQNTSSDYSAIFVMNDDKVYGIGRNFFGCLGLGHDSRISDYKLIEDLCGLNIEEFFGWGVNVFGRSLNNKIFSWGTNCYGQLALG